jgi:hypothetical protein
LIENVGFISGVVPILVYLNVAAGGVAGYLGFKLWQAEKSKLA